MGFRQRHPVLTGLGIFFGIIIAFCTGVFLLLFKFYPSRLYSSNTEGIGILELKTPIFSADETLKSLHDFKINKNIRAIVFRVESPGGVVGASQEIYEEIRRINASKKVVVSMGSVAASGGYYVSLGGERILAMPGTLTGSIGVIVKFPNLQGLYEKIGYHSEVIKSGIHKDLGSTDRSPTTEEKALMQSVINNVHDQFVQAVVERRGLQEEKVRNLADGRIFTGQQAMELGLIDQLGNFQDAIDLAAEFAGLKGEPELIYPEERGFSLFRWILGRDGLAMCEHLLSCGPVLSYVWKFAP